MTVDHSRPQTTDKTCRSRSASSIGTVQANLARTRSSRASVRGNRAPEWRRPGRRFGRIAPVRYQRPALLADNLHTEGKLSALEMRATGNAGDLGALRLPLRGPHRGRTAQPLHG
jgi:hypothetical protein